jgi:hypothetical protein
MDKVCILQEIEVPEKDLQLDMQNFKIPRFPYHTPILQVGMHQSSGGRIYSYYGRHLSGERGGGS